MPGAIGDTCDMNTHALSNRIRGLVLVLTLGLAATAGAVDALATRYYEDAVARFSAGDLRGAEIQLKNTLTRDPGQLAARILMGRVQLGLERPREAEESLIEAEKLGADPLLTALPLARARNALSKYADNIQKIVPTRAPPALQPDLWVELGLARLYSQDPDGAEIAFQEALKIDPSHLAARVGLARIPLADQRFDAATRAADAVIAANPDAADAWYVKGAAAHGQGRFGDAAAAYAKARELDPRHLQAAIGEATALLEGGKPGDTVALLDPLRGQHPGSVIIPYIQSEALKALGRTAESEKALAAASAIIRSFAPTDVAGRPADLLLFGTIAFDTGQLETAYKFLALYVELQGGDIQGRKMLGKTLLALGKPGDARQVLVRASAAELADAEALALLGDANIQLGDLVAAERYYRNALKNHKGGPAIVRRLAMAQFQSGRRDLALGTLQELVDKTQGASGSDTSLLLGMLYYSEGRINEAAGLAERIVKQEPKNYNARNLLGLIALARGDAAKGRRMLEEIVAAQPDFRPARYNLIKLDIAQGRTAVAAAALREIIARDPKDSRALLEAARLAQSQGDLRVAIANLEKIRELEPNNVQTNVELINAYLALRDTDQAMNRALELDRTVPNDFDVKDALARVQIARGENTDAANTLKEVNRFAGEDAQRLVYTGRLQAMVRADEDAAWSFTKALTIQPDNLDARIALAGALFRQRKLDDAESEIDQVLQRAPRNVPALTLLGDLRMAQGRAADAVVIYSQARAVADVPQAVVGLHRALMTLGRQDEALGAIEEWNAKHPGNPLVTGLLANHLQYVGDTAGALVLRRKMVELQPGNAAAWKNLAAALADTDNESALKAALRAQELAPNDPAVLDAVGWTLIQIGELDKGLANLREALARDATNPTIRYHLGVALQEFGNLPEARRELEQALRLSKNFPERDDAKARIIALPPTR